MKTYRFENGAFAIMAPGRTEDQALFKAFSHYCYTCIVPVQRGLGSRIIVTSTKPVIAEKGFGSPIKKDKS